MRTREEIQRAHDMKPKPKRQLSLEARRRLEAVAKAMTEHPNQVDMRAWFATAISLPTGFVRAGGCGTAGCIGGWALALFATGKVITLREANRASLMIPPASVLHLSSEQTPRLFHVCHWPKRQAAAYRRATTPAGITRATVARIKQFIACDGKR